MLAPAVSRSRSASDISSAALGSGCLGLNGNAITVSKALFEALLQEGKATCPTACHARRSQGSWQTPRKAETPVTLGHVFPSPVIITIAHVVAAATLIPMRRLDWLSYASVHGRDLAQGQVDGFCVGAPWSALAAAAGAGAILHQGTDIVHDCPEKVLAFRAEWVLSHKEEVSALAEAVGDASRWAASPAPEFLVTLLTSTAGKDVTAAMLEEFSTRQPPLRSASSSGLRLTRRDQSRPARRFGSRPNGSRRSDHLLGRSCRSSGRVYAPALGPAIPRAAATPVIFDGPAFSPTTFILPCGARRRAHQRMIVRSTT